MAEVRVYPAGHYLFNLCFCAQWSASRDLEGQGQGQGSPVLEERVLSHQLIRSRKNKGRLGLTILSKPAASAAGLPWVTKQRPGKVRAQPSQETLGTNFKCYYVKSVYANLTKKNHPFQKISLIIGKKLLKWIIYYKYSKGSLSPLGLKTSKACLHPLGP